jgi:hypothetical protein
MMEIQSHELQFGKKLRGFSLGESQQNAMSNSEKTERWAVLAELAAKEQDPNKLMALVTEINELLGEKQPPSNFAPPTGTS